VGDDSIYLAPEETQKDTPPSYASAQADAVPPYWETTTIHLPSGASASSIPGDAAFDGSDDEADYDDGNSPGSELRPLSPSRSGRTSLPLPTQNRPPPIVIPGAYDFERVDYDVPPPGSPTRAMTNDYGNTNSHIPSYNTNADLAEYRRGGARSWFSRAAANVLPSHYRDVHRLGLGGPSTSAAHVGGGGMNDGMFSNLAAKPESRLYR